MINHTPLEIFNKTEQYVKKISKEKISFEKAFKEIIYYQKQIYPSNFWEKLIEIEIEFNKEYENISIWLDSLLFSIKNKYPKSFWIGIVDFIPINNKKVILIDIKELSYYQEKNEFLDVNGTELDEFYDHFDFDNYYNTLIIEDNPLIFNSKMLYDLYWIADDEKSSVNEISKWVIVLFYSHFILKKSVKKKLKLKGKGENNIFTVIGKPVIYYYNPPAYEPDALFCFWV